MADTHAEEYPEDGSGEAVRNSVGGGEGEGEQNLVFLIKNILFGGGSCRERQNKTKLIKSSMAS